MQPERLALTLSGAVSAAPSSCIPATPQERTARADVIFEGVALQGPTATGVQRFRVKRYLKSSGPRIVRVQTGHRVLPGGGGSTTSVSITVLAGETWRIYGSGRAQKVLKTSQCHGSKRLSKAPASRRS